MNALTSLPIEVHRSAQRGELQKVVKWLNKGGVVGALCSFPSAGGRPSTTTLLQTAAANGHMAMVNELLKRGASVDLQTRLGVTPLMAAAYYGHLSIVLRLLQHSADPDLQDTDGGTALMLAAGKGHEACVQALLRAKAKTELLDQGGRTALQWAEYKGHTAITALIQQHAVPRKHAAAAPAEPAVSFPTSLPFKLLESARRGELQKVVKWLREGGAGRRAPAAATARGRRTLNLQPCCTLASRPAANLEMVRELLKRGASVDLPAGLGSHRAHEGCEPTAASPSCSSSSSTRPTPTCRTSTASTALMRAAAMRATEACVQAHAASQGQHRAARRQGPHRPARGRARTRAGTSGCIGHRAAHPAARRAAAASRRGGTASDADRAGGAGGTRRMRANCWQSERPA